MFIDKSNISYCSTGGGAFLEFIEEKRYHHCLPWALNFEKERTMSLNTLEEIANYIVSDGKGILAADESNLTCGKRFDSMSVESTEINRRDYREMLFRADGMQDNMGGVILFDETIRQSAEDGTPLVELIKNQELCLALKLIKV